jgi:hypothetical protein
MIAVEAVGCRERPLGVNHNCLPRAVGPICDEYLALDCAHRGLGWIKPMKSDELLPTRRQRYGRLRSQGGLEGPVEASNTKVVPIARSRGTG